ncbi:MAG TPA: sodium:proline symporter [Gammaproteobacteria bacterium]|nr:sodium:proline symporter [Gammaproteobacteria bacterium]
MTIKLSAAIGSGVAAGVLSTLAQAAVWILFTDQFPAALFRDARLTAAIVMGRQVLPPPAGFDATAMAVATGLHFALSITYGILLALLLSRWPYRHTAVVGTGFGLALYLVNLYGFTHLYPWFARVRGANTLVAHIVFGLTGAGVYRALVRYSAAREPPGG